LERIERVSPRADRTGASPGRSRAVLENRDLAARLDSIAWPMKRIELTFLISQRVPSGSPDGAPRR